MTRAKERESYPWYPTEFRGNVYVRMMTPQQELAYRRLLDAMWEMGSLPTDINGLARLAGFPEKEFKSIWTFPLSLCWVQNKLGDLINPDLQRELEFYLENYDPPPDY